MRKEARQQPSPHGLLGNSRNRRSAKEVEKDAATKTLGNVSVTTLVMELSMGIILFGATKELVLWIRDTYGVRTCIETGTNRAATSLWASTEFTNVITVEGFEPLYRQAVESFGSRKNIEFLLGDSRNHIRRIVEGLTEPALFWLDAHWCGTETFGDSDECPVMGELEALKHSRVPHFILIDDARLFLAPPPPPHVAAHWPDIATICRAFESQTAPHHIAMHEDVIAAVPAHAKEQFVEFLRQNAGKAPPTSVFRRGLRRLRRTFGN